MEITNNKLKKTDNLRKYNDRFAMWLKQYAEELSTSYTIDKTTGELISSSVDPQSVLKRASRIYDCLKFWNWDKHTLPLKFCTSRALIGVKTHTFARTVQKLKQIIHKLRNANI